jgi:hypothetical protein
MEEKIANYVGKMLNVGCNNSHAWDPRFCVTLEFGKRWVDKLLIARLDGLDEVVINYDHHMVWCRFCMPLDHKVKDYPTLARHHNPSRSIAISRNGNIIRELKLKKIHPQGKSTCLGDICKLNLTQLIKKHGWNNKWWRIQNYPP